MSASGAELLKRVKEQIREVDPSEVSQLLGEGVVVVDCRETEELAAGMIPGAVHIPRSYLETRIEATVPDRSQRVILYCASGVRSAFGAHTLMAEMGYDDVESMTGGFTLWKDRGYEVEVPRALTPEQRDRYSRHLLVPEVGPEGQQKLLDARVLLLGAGGLGSPTALYLAAAGVGTIGIVDDDVVDLSNLQRQVIHSTDRLGVPKTESAAEAIRALNPDVEVVGYQTRLDASNIMEIIEGWDVIVDGVDNFPTRYLLNDASVRLKLPTGSTAKRLSTGSTDVTLQGELGKSIGSFDLHASARYKFAGHGTTSPLRDTWGAGAGGSARLNKTITIGSDYDWQQSSFAGAGPSSEVTGWAAFRVTKRLRLSTYVGGGLSRNSADYFAGTALTIRL